MKQKIPDNSEVGRWDVEFETYMISTNAVPSCFNLKVLGWGLPRIEGSKLSILLEKNI